MLSKSFESAKLFQSVEQELIYLQSLAKGIGTRFSLKGKSCEEVRGQHMTSTTYVAIGAVGRRLCLVQQAPDEPSDRIPSLVLSAVFPSEKPTARAEELRLQFDPRTRMYMLTLSVPQSAQLKACRDHIAKQMGMSEEELGQAMGLAAARGFIAGLITYAISVRTDYRNRRRIVGPAN